MENTKLQLSDLKVNNLPELQGWKEKQEKLVADNPFVEITDNKSYDIACKSRTNLLKGRTELKIQDKFIASELSSFRKDVKLETDVLIAITFPFEEKQQTEVKRYETIKEVEKQQKAQLEFDRIAKIKKYIDDFESGSFGIIQATNIDNVALHKTMLDALVNAEFDCEEYDIMFEQSRDRIQASWDAKCGDIQEKEEQRLRNEQLEKENIEVKRISDLQALRLNEILPFVAFGESIVLTNLSVLEETVYSNILASKKALFEADAKDKKEAQEKLDADNLERENKSKAYKEKIFEIRKVRLTEIGITENENGCFVSENEDSLMNLEFVYNCNEVELEEAIAESIDSIKTGNLQRKDAEKQKAIDLELSLADATKLKKENKARVAKYSLDKKILKEFIKSLEFSNPVPELQNEDMQPILDKILLELENTRGHLLTEINLF